MAPLLSPDGSISIVSVNVALPAQLPALHRGQRVRSGIDKRPAPGPALALSFTNLEGDGQADLSAHGGPDKAVYAYSADLWPAWEADLGRPLGPGAFGENLTVAGATEADVCIGDRWRWGDAELEVCQPRTPCFKLTIHAGTPEAGRVMRRSGRSGWYLRVVRTGTVPTSGTITVVPHPGRVSIRDVTSAAATGHPDALVRALSVAALAGEWRQPLQAQLAG